MPSRIGMALTRRIAVPEGNRTEQKYICKKIQDFFTPHTCPEIIKIKCYLKCENLQQSHTKVLHLPSHILRPLWAILNNTTYIRYMKKCNILILLFFWTFKIFAQTYEFKHDWEMKYLIMLSGVST
jgi:hypothetical protein